MALSGSGTANDPYLIGNTADFDEFRTFVKTNQDKHYKLTADVGSVTSIIDTDSAFSGVFDGNGYSIRGIIMSVLPFAGLFSTVSGTVKNLFLDCSTAIISTISLYYGAICGLLTGRIENCKIRHNTVVTTNSSSVELRVGGVAGSSVGTIDYCVVTGNIKVAGESGKGAIGGLIGSAGNGGKCYRSVFCGSLTAQGSGKVPPEYCGRLFGEIVDGNRFITVDNYYWDGVTVDTEVTNSVGSVVTTSEFNTVEFWSGLTYNLELWKVRDLNADSGIFPSFGGTYYTLSYVAGEGGAINGAQSQKIVWNKNGNTVTAVANPGYTFTKWSDGTTTLSRQETFVKSDKTFTANFRRDWQVNYNGEVFEHLTANGASIKKIVFNGIEL